MRPTTLQLQVKAEALLTFLFLHLLLHYIASSYFSPLLICSALQTNRAPKMSYHRPTRPSASASHDSNNMYEDPPHDVDQLQYEYHDVPPQGYRKGKG